MILMESRINFDFATSHVIKFDEVDYFVRKYQKLNDSKGVDFLAYDQSTLWFIEVKNFTGYEKEENTIERLKVRNGTIESVDLEVALKVRSSIACLVGAGSRQISDYNLYYQKMKEIINNNKKFKVILFLEGNFGKTPRDEARILHIISQSIKNQLSWLNTDVHVEKTNLRRCSRIFQII